MNEHPILFRGDMVRAILENRKTQTRQIIRPQPKIYFKDEGERSVIVEWRKKEETFSDRFFTGVMDKVEKYLLDDCPFGKPGDTLWVRETWGIDPNDYPFEDKGYVVYKATDEILQDDGVLKIGGKYHWGWTPSIFMPRWASRLSLTVMQEKVSALQDISEEDAWAEGVSYDLNDDSPYIPKGRCLFATLWNSLYAKPKPVYKEKGIIDHYESYPWEDIHETHEYHGKPWIVIGNPLVWVVEFEKKPNYGNYIKWSDVAKKL